MADASALALADDADRLAAIALAEDGPRDISSLVSVTTDQQGSAFVEVREAMVVAGLRYADAVIAACGLSEVTWTAVDGAALAEGVVLGRLDGSLREILRAERPLLNLLQRACGIATLTSRFVAAVNGTGCRILHTRKTTPGLRQFEIAAVVAGGGTRHRVDLADDVMIKDNHWQALHQQGSTLRRVLTEARMLGASSLQVEVEHIDQLDEACAAGASRLLIDNQTPETVAAWVIRARSQRPEIELEATGGITLGNIRSYAETEVDFISIGALTHSVRAADLGIEVEGQEGRG